MQWEGQDELLLTREVVKDTPVIGRIAPAESFRGNVGVMSFKLCSNPRDVRTDEHEELEYEKRLSEVKDVDACLNLSLTASVCASSYVS